MIEKTQKELIKIADRVFSLWIRRRDRGKCITCGTIRPIEIMQNGHFVPRDCKPLRYDEKNCNTQCKDCNEYGRGELKAYRQALVEKYGEKIVKSMENRKQEIKQFSRKELQEIIKKYE